MRVLVADDEAVSRRVLHRTLTRWGYEVLVCEDGLQAWEHLKGPGAPRLVILDWVMPGMDGVEICRKLRERASEPYTYILLLTAKNESTDIIEGLEAGADDYLTKPFDPKALRVRPVSYTHLTLPTN